jgi:ABC-type glycerol-3-phosphate transport system substrate-binding protein
MISKRTVSFVAGAALLGLAACGGTGGDSATVQQDTAYTTIPTQDTVAVEQTVEVHTDTIRDTRP